MANKKLIVTLASTPLSASHARITSVVEQVEAIIDDGFSEQSQYIEFQYINSDYSLEGLDTYYTELPSIIFWYEGDDKPAHVINGADDISRDTMLQILAERFNLYDTGLTVNIFGFLVGKNYLPYFIAGIIVLIITIVFLVLKWKRKI